MTTPLPSRGRFGNAVSVQGANLAGAFTSCNQPTVADIAVVVNFVAE